MNSRARRSGLDVNAPTVFVVDDEPDVLIFVKDLLEAKGYRVWVFSSGRDVIAALDEHVPDAILLDIMMPEMNGYEVCRYIRELHAKPEISRVKICFLSARNSPEDVRRGLEAGADAYMGKPFDIRSLLDQVESLTVAGGPKAESPTERRARIHNGGGGS